MSGGLIDYASLADDVLTGLNGTYASPQGAWSSTTAYGVNAVVTYNGGTYRAKAASTNVTPGTDATKWESWGGGGSAAALLDRGNWATTTAYAVGDVVTQGGQRFACCIAHTGGTFAADLAASKWVALDAVAAVPSSLATTKGDVLAATTAGALTRVGVGGDGQLLTADSTASAGVGWRSPTGGLKNFYGMIPVATGANILTNVGPGVTDGTQSAVMTESTHSVLFPVDVIRLVYASPGAGPTDAATIKASIRTPFDNYYQVTFNGATSGTLTGQGTLVSDPIPMNFPAGGVTIGGSGGGEFSYFRVRTYAVATGSSGKIPSAPGSNSFVQQTRSGITPAEGNEYSTSATDKTLTGTVTSGTATGNACRPALIIGYPVSGSKPFTLGVGDSIVQGTGDTATGTLAPYGFLARALYANGLPYLIDGTPSTQIPNTTALTGLASSDIRPTVPGTTSSRNQYLWDGATYIVCEFGHNNLSSAIGNEVYTTTQQRITGYWRWLSRRGAKVFQTTITPRTTSTDSWATIGNQTVDSNNANRVSFNGWLRDGAPLDASFAPVAVGTSGARRCAVYDSTGALVTAASGSAHPLLGGVLEVADIAETARNSGIWKASYTADGAHPVTSTHILMQAAVPASLFV